MTNERSGAKTLGWVAIKRVTEKSTYLVAAGVGQVIEVDIDVRWSAKPFDGSFFSIMGGGIAGAAGFVSSAVNSI